MTAENIEIKSKKINLLYQLKNNIIKHIQKYKSKEYLNAFILGNNKDIDSEIITSYQTNGISHLLAISGMHITLLSSIFLFIFNHLSKYKKLNYFLTIIILLLYIFLSNFAPSIIRATLLFVALSIKKGLNLKIDNLYFLILIFSIYLLYNPYIIYNLGFVFSFTITFFLIMTSEYLKTKKGLINQTFTVSLIAFIAGIPVLINNFSEINLLSPFINVIFVPIISFLIYPLSLIALLIKPLDNILYFLINQFETLSLIFSKITIFKLTLKHINILGIIFYYLSIYYVLNKLAQNKKIYIFLLLVILIFRHNINYLNNDTKITAIDVGQGDSTLISLDHNKGNILIDTGGKVSFNKKPYNLSKNKTIPYLKSEGIKQIETMILTHGDYDHMGEAINLVNNFKVEKVIFNCGEFNDLEKELIKVLDKKKIKYYSCIKELNSDKNKLYFLQTKEYDNENDNSNVIYTELDGYKFMFMGDASNTTEKEILDRYNLSNINVLKAGHHGSKTSSSEEFINKINPRYSIISVGKNNRYGHPNKEVLDNLKDSKIYRTDIDGSIMFKITNNKLKIKKCH